MALRTVPEWLTRWEYAHRGLHSAGVPENSLAAAQAAITAGMGVECDIQRSVDDHPMVFHDWNVDRLTNANGLTESWSADQLEGLCLLGTDQSPVRLTKFLDCIGGRVPLLIEIKSTPDYDPDWTALYVANSLRQYRGPCAVMSFDPRVPAWFKRREPQIPCGLVMREDDLGYTRTAQSRETALAQANPDFLAYHIDALPKPWVARLRAAGLPVLTWTVNSPESRRLAQDYADALICEGAGLA